MPYLSIQSNKALSPEQTQELLKNASQNVAEILGKPESYVMVSIPPAIPMSFAGSTDALAYLELKSIGLPETKTSQLSETLCNLVSTAMDIDPQRIYIEFSDAPRKMWGWDKRTF